jgi:phosphohistidine phosphatase
MLRLYILRHAKALVAMPGMKDFERPLAQRGHSDCVQLAWIMAERGYLPERILCSGAKRTRETLDGVLPAWGKAERPSIEFSERLYSGDHGTYLAAIRSLSAVRSAMVVGHNPNCEMVASLLCGGGEPEAVKNLLGKFPTCALAVFDLATERWEETTPGSGQLVDFIFPDEA